MFLRRAFICALTALVGARAPGLRLPRQTETDGLQNMVTWDEYSLFINGTRVNIFSGEVHPFRMPVQSLHLDVFQKVKSMGFNAVSAYFHWGMHEPKRGEISFEGFRDLQPFFDAAMKAGIYIIARPGPYINAEVTGGGLPGWGQHTAGLWRTSNASFIDASAGYMKAIGTQLAANQITNGGPVILVQVENEYSGYQPPYTEDFAYESELKSLLRESGVTVPLTVNDAWPGGHFTDIDIYGYDSYPNGFNCSFPDDWLSGAVDSTEYFWGAHLQYSPQSPNAVFEFQGGSLDAWGGAGYENCAQLTGPAFERVFYKNEFAMSTTMLNLYMVFGGTNWGGIAHPGVYTSYDYGAAIAEDRTLREKYYELKLQANFRAVSPAFLTSRPINIFNTQSSFTGNQALKTTQVLDAVGNKTGFYVVRQLDASIDAVQTYTLTVPTSIGTLTIPILGGNLALNGKDSKIHVVDYEAGQSTLLYSTGEILTWATIDERDVVLVYGNSGELHETAFKFSSAPPAATVISGTGKIKTQVLSNNSLALQYTTTGQTVVEIGNNTLLYILDRESAYQFWVLHLPSAGAFAQFDTANPIVIKGGYLIRSVASTGNTLAFTGDLNSTHPVSFEIIAPGAFTSATLNGVKLSLAKTKYGTLTAQKTAVLPTVTLPDLSTLQWKTADSLPEIQPQYSDALWTVANHTTTINALAPLTPVVLYAGDYGFHTGNILWRAHFTATGAEEGFAVHMQGGAAFGYSVWLDATFIGSWEGDPNFADFNGTHAFPGGGLRKASTHVLTIVQDHMGNEEDWWAAGNDFQTPRGVLDYHFIGSNSTSVTIWKVAGNLGGEDYVDTTRGPLNEGGLFGERQGWHLPGFNDAAWARGAPTQGIAHAGVAFYRTTFNLNVPQGVDYPLAIALTKSMTPSNFRAQIYVNGYSFGKYVNNIGPQSVFPVPQGILNYNGLNTLAISLWANDAGGARIDSLALKLTAQIESSMGAVENQPLTVWTSRPGAF
ncbi:glycoside hydrolase family 35 protein [Roridomyces roridus]|uniref:Beta-galactosidase n=1 Tax=Roridomyces roridus TaxID=1738132 RepID=A0AAD7C3Y3_9AGAR|nr:glycoside hydrolase family 35 protein [Roridomyces roridus]